MADITDPIAIEFSNLYSRATANALAQRYYWASALIDQWGSLGSGQAALDVMRVSIWQWSSFAYGQGGYAQVNDYVRRWFSYGQTVIPNGTERKIVDGSPEDGRPANSNTKTVLLVDRADETRLAWDANSSASQVVILQVLKRGPDLLELTDAANAVNQMIAIRDDLDIPGKLDTVLALATNPVPLALQQAAAQG